MKEITVHIKKVGTSLKGKKAFDYILIVYFMFMVVITVYPFFIRCTW
ncbi:MAG: hypothetical protein WCD89_08500 [Anaerocolumna sp.]